MSCRYVYDKKHGVKKLDVWMNAAFPVFSNSMF